jgi:DNA integrity scanning protein DisA with diadenylate cyclase activity
VLVIAKNDREQVFVMQEFVLLVLVLQVLQRVLKLQRVLVLQVLQRVLVLQVLQRVLVLQAQLVQVLKQLAQKLQVQPQLSVSEELHHVVLLQLVHSMKKKSTQMMNPKSLGYMF